MPAIVCFAVRCKRPTLQRGMVTMVVMLFLIATVVFALSQMLNVSSGNVIDGQRQGDSTAAFFLAESGLDKGRAALSTSSLTDAVCTGSGTPPSYPASYVLPRGNVTLSGLSNPQPCGGSGQSLCTSCTLTATGTVGIATRTLSRTISLNVLDGVTCTAIPSTACTNNNPVTWWLDLKNPYATDAIGVFALAVGKQGAQTGASCTNASCQLAWDSQKMTGLHALESLGNVVTIPAGKTYRIYQTDSTQDLAEVGMLFRGSSAAPTLTGRHSLGGATVAGAAYWDAVNSTSTVSKYPAALIGQTNDGTATNSNAEVCLDPTNSSNKTQTCTSWCYGGDTLVFGFAAEAANLADDITSVTFNTGGAAPQNIPLTAFINEHKYPTSTSPNSPPTDVYASIWYARNPDFLSASDVQSGALVTGYAGAVFTGVIARTSTQLTVSLWSGASLQVGDVITGGIDAGTKICAIAAGGGNGTYTVTTPSGTCAAPVGQAAKHDGTAMTVLSSTLNVTAQTIPSLAVGDTIFVNSIAKGKIASLGTGNGGIGTYNLNSSQAFGTTTIASDEPTVTSSSGTAVPVAGTMIISVKNGTGVFAAGMTTVATSPAPTATTFKLSQRPTTPLANATICGGTCAFFVHGGGTTRFTLAKSPTDLSWASGFICLKGVDIEPAKVTSPTFAPRLWTELVR